ncbi:MBL fold metallo-hydrolase [Paenarthrobacter ureafaciens]|uniref:MBL fold metallo-hydrolase n=1 Tax=Paenarthrobacter ureafaciens TaxID=37931 RepID=UPI001FB374FB|nr:MBL fold metallo-hydrolase [Paenarthrobacter ureafaciens]UOD80800.1 MBL fold metallo-hydrolase [Paenarthrobacter ureafaciens]WNZ03459.1 MBL fold metallo-hydrolase [Paenarthrobacter ureafaciens]
MSAAVTLRAGGGPDVGHLTRAADNDGGLRFWWLGQAGFAFEHAGRRVLVDPYLSDSLARKYAGKVFPHVRLHPVPVDPAAVLGVEAVLHSHAHTDHLDPDTVEGLLQNNSPLFVAPRARRDVAIQRNIPADRLRAVTAGDRVELGVGMSVTAVPAAHEDLEFDANGDSVFLGYILDIAGIRIYHSGDCVPYGGQVELLRNHHVDLALLPINGRDSRRLQNGVPGNMTVREAAALCQEAAIPAVVGHHFGLFDFNTVPREDAARELGEVAGDLQWTLPEVGRCYSVEPAREPAEQLKGP